jgi:2-polyprenyl-3-methyl-5-hydroxy-6-metoxy-1,4-benzoquinol methylase
MRTEEHPVCPICSDTHPKQRYQITRFEILECRRCTQIFLYPCPSPEEIHAMFAELYTTGGGSVPELASYYGFCYDDDPANPLVQLYESWLVKIEETHKTGSILDVGCGTGLFLSVARRRGWKVYGIDSNLEATAHARDHFGLDVWIADFEDFSSEGKTFDVITGWDIIEHTRDPIAVLKSMRRILAPGGIVALSTPNQKSILDLIAGSLYHLSGGRMTAALEKFYIEQHFLYFTPDTMTAALKLAGLDLVVLEPELTDLRRLTLNPLMRLILITLLSVSKLIGRENRIFLMATARE